MIPSRLILACLALALLLAAPLNAAPRKTATTKPVDPALVPIEDDPKLPRVLLIGDSISMGYTLPVRALLKGKANIHHPPGNCGDTARGLQFMDRWLGEGKWDVIHFNFGLHDLKYLDDHGNYVTPDKGKQVASPEKYGENLKALVERLKKTGAKLIWASTTPVPDGTTGRVKGDEVQYNIVAEQVMKDSGIAIDDLHAVVAADPSLQRPKNVHFSAHGYDVLAAKVAEHVTAALPH